MRDQTRSPDDSASSKDGGIGLVLDKNVNQPRGTRDPEKEIRHGKRHDHEKEFAGYLERHEHERERCDSDDRGPKGVELERPVGFIAQGLVQSLPEPGRGAEHEYRRHERNDAQSERNILPANGENSGYRECQQDRCRRQSELQHLVFVIDKSSSHLTPKRLSIPHGR